VWGRVFAAKLSLHLLLFSLPPLAEAFDYLDAPVYRITGADIPTPYAKNLEESAFPDIEHVIRAVKKQLNM